MGRLRFIPPCLWVLVIAFITAAVSGSIVVYPLDVSAHRRPHKTPHGGVAIVLGPEEYHVELVLDSKGGTMTANIVDGDLENFVHASSPTFEIVAEVDGVTEKLLFEAVQNSASAEKAGDAAVFVARADWLRRATTFEGVLSGLKIRGKTFDGVKFNFPNGNDRDWAH